MKKKKFSFKYIIASALSLILVFESSFVSYAGKDWSAIIKQKQAEIDAAEKEKKALKNSLTDVEKVKKSLMQSKADLTEYVTRLDENVDMIVARIDDLNGQLDVKAQEIETTKAELEDAIETKDAQYEAMTKRVQSMYEEGDSYYLEILAGSKGYAEFLNNMDYVSQLADYDNRVFTQYKETVEYVTVCKEQLEAEEQVLKETKATAESEQKALEDLISEKQKEIEKFENDISNKDKIIKEYEAEIAEQTAVISELEKAVEQARQSMNSERGYDGGVFCWPAPSYTRVSDDYGYRIHPILKVQQFHTGVDLAAPGGSDILAAYDGAVVSAEYNASMGNYIMIDHGDGLFTIYMHSSKLLVKAGDEVKRGQKIALVGSTGRSTGNHLHFSVRLNGSYVSPWNYIAKP